MVVPGGKMGKESPQSSTTGKCEEKMAAVSGTTTATTTALKIATSTGTATATATAKATTATAAAEKSRGKSLLSTPPPPSLPPHSYPSHPSHHPMHYYPPPYPPQYDPSRTARSAGVESSPSSSGVIGPGPYTKAQYDRLKQPPPPPPNSIQARPLPSHHFPGVMAGNKSAPPPILKNARSTSFDHSKRGKKTNHLAGGGNNQLANAATTMGRDSTSKNVSSPSSSMSRPPPPPPPPHHAYSHHFSGYHPPPPHSSNAAAVAAAEADHRAAWAEYHGYYFGGDATYHRPPPENGPYRYSDTTLRREAMSSANHGATINLSSNISMKNADGGIGGQKAPQSTERDNGATSPTQIEDSHREEVTTMGCTCKKTKCLKLYCQCFAVKIYCGTNCRCQTCSNVEAHEFERQGAIRNILIRNPHAFDTKFQKDKVVQLAHKLGCKCRKSACMKKYCECYAGSVRCSENCRCVGCKNTASGPSGGGGSSGYVVSLPPVATRKPLASGLFAAIAAQPPVEETRKREPYMMNAAHNLAFLKHASSKAKAQGAPRRTPSQDGDGSSSMPSLASSEPSPIDSQPDEEVSTAEKNRSVADAPNTAERTAVNALLMAAVAMTEMSDPAKSSSSPVSTPPGIRNLKTEKTDDDYNTPQKNLFKQKFQSPKRKKSDHESVSPGPMRNGREDSSAESSPSQGDENENDDSPKRELAEMAVTPSVAQKVKRSRIGSTQKIGPNRNLGDIMASSHKLSAAVGSPMMMETPKHAKKTSSTADLTPVSARCIDFKRMHVKGSP